jgi:hypothetical protein
MDVRRRTNQPDLLRLRSNAAPYKIGPSHIPLEFIRRLVSRMKFAVAYWRQTVVDRLSDVRLRQDSERVPLALSDSKSHLRQGTVANAVPRNSSVYGISLKTLI